MNQNPFHYFKTSREVIQLAVMMYVRFPLSLRNVEELLHERGIDVCHESIRLWVDRFGPLFAGKIRGSTGVLPPPAKSMAVASRRGFREGQRNPALSLAGRRS
jgi:hypothetical protein